MRHPVHTTFPRALARFLAALAALAALLLQPAHALEKVKLGLTSPVGPQLGSLFYGMQLGFFAEENIQLEFVAFRGSAVLMPQIANKSVDIGLPSPDYPVIALSKGQPYPAVFFFNLYRGQIFEFVVPEKSAVRSLKDLKGKEIGVAALTASNVPLTRAIFSDLGLDPNKDIQLVAVGLGPAAWKRLESGEIDALNLYLQEHIMVRQSGLAIRHLQMQDKFASIFSNGYMAHTDTVRQRPELLARFGRAVAKSLVACRANPEACQAAYWWYEPSSKPEPAKQADYLKAAAERSKAAYGLLAKFEPGQPERWGEFSDQTWRNLLHAMRDGGVIGSADLPLNALYTNALIDEINRFDPAAVAAKARHAAPR